MLSLVRVRDTYCAALFTEPDRGIGFGSIVPLDNFRTIDGRYIGYAQSPEDNRTQTPKEWANRLHI